jgi:hypothetical protein
MEYFGGGEIKLPWTRLTDTSCFDDVTQNTALNTTLNQKKKMFYSEHSKL